MSDLIQFCLPPIKISAIIHDTGNINQMYQALQGGQQHHSSAFSHQSPFQPDTQTSGCCFHSPTPPCYPSRRDLFPPLVDPTKVDGDPDLFHSVRLSDYNIVKTPARIRFQA